MPQDEVLNMIREEFPIIHDNLIKIYLDKPNLICDENYIKPWTYGRVTLVGESAFA